MRRVSFVTGMRRRTLLKTLAVIPCLPALAAAQTEKLRVVTLRAGELRQRIVPEPYPETALWGYNGTVPGPLLRFRRGDRVRIVVENGLPQDTTVHWHGLRVPNSMDGVPHLTQPPIAAGGRFVYEFDLPDAGTYWYHPHERSHEQVARGLFGAFIVEEHAPIKVDRDVTWVLSDWRLTPQAEDVGDFVNLFDLTHAGRLGNTVAINGKFTPRDGVFSARSGERIRLRLINAATARIFRLHFSEHQPRIIALDGQAVDPHAEPSGIVIGPGMRTDLVLDCPQQPGARFEVSESFYGTQQRRLIEIVYEDTPLRAVPLDAPIALAANAHPHVDTVRAQRIEIALQGGAKGALREAEFHSQRMPLGVLAREHQVAWAINGVAHRHHAHQPLATLKRSAHYVLALHNDTAWYHPLHLHGHFFRILSRNGEPAPRTEWRDTLLLAPRERAEVGLVADNPGDWMLHCHVLQHQHGGMMATLRVS